MIPDEYRLLFVDERQRHRLYEWGFLTPEGICPCCGFDPCFTPDTNPYCDRCGRIMAPDADSGALFCMFCPDKAYDG